MSDHAGRGMLGRFANSQANDRGTLKVGLSKPPVIMSSGATSAPAVPKDATAPLAQRLPAVVDLVPEVAGAGIILIDAKGSRTLRSPKTAGQPYIVFQMGGVLPQLTPQKAGPQKASALSEEVANLGFNCVGAALSWVGVIGMVSAAPVTGGTTLAGAAWIGVGALASSGQCVASGVRVYNEVTDDQASNSAMDKDPLYVNSMRAADGIGLVSAASGLKALNTARKATGGLSALKQAASSPISRPQRRVLTQNLALVGGKRASTAMINHVVKLKILEGLGGGIGLAGSSYGGLMKELSIWVFVPGEDGPP